MDVLRGRSCRNDALLQNDQQVRSKIRKSKIRDSGRSYASPKIALLISVGGAEVGEVGEVERRPSVPREAEKLVSFANVAIDFWLSVLAQRQSFWADKLADKRILLDSLWSENEGNNA